MPARGNREDPSPPCRAERPFVGTQHGYAGSLVPRVRGSVRCRECAVVPEPRHEEKTLDDPDRPPPDQRREAVGQPTGDAADRGSGAPETDPDFASEHESVTTGDRADAGPEDEPEPESPQGLGGMN